MGLVMAERANEEVIDKKTEKARRKAEKLERKKKRGKAGSEDNLDAEETVGGKIVTFFVTLIIFLIWIAIIALLIKMDVGGFGSTVLAPVIKDVPYLNRILPESVLNAELSTEESAYAYTSLDDAIERIKELEVELVEAQNASNEDASYISELEAQAAELAQYKQEEADFEAVREKWYEEVVFSDEAPDITNYREYYESIDPANAEVLYKQVVEQSIYDEKVADYVKTYSSMKPKEAAAIFDTMTDDLQLVAEILMNMDAQSRADILGKMNSDTAAKVTEIMEP